MRRPGEHPAHSRNDIERVVTSSSLRRLALQETRSRDAIDAITHNERDTVEQLGGSNLRKNLRSHLPSCSTLTCTVTRAAPPQSAVQPLHCQPWNDVGSPHSATPLPAEIVAIARLAPPNAKRSSGDASSQRRRSTRLPVRERHSAHYAAHHSRQSYAVECVAPARSAAYPSA